VKRNHSQALGIQDIEDGRSNRFPIAMKLAIYAHNDDRRALAGPFVISHSVTPKADDTLGADHVNQGNGLQSASMV
jgi:hypothetical protein